MGQDDITDYESIGSKDYIRALSRLKSGLFSETRKNRLDLIDSRARFRRLREKRPELNKHLKAFYITSFAVLFGLLLILLYSVSPEEFFLRESSYLTDLFILNLLINSSALIFYILYSFSSNEFSDIRKKFVKIAFGVNVIYLFLIIFTLSIFLYDSNILQEGISENLPGFFQTIFNPYLEASPVVPFFNTLLIGIAMVVLPIVLSANSIRHVSKGYAKTLILSREELPDEDDQDKDIIKEYVTFTGKSSEYEKKEDVDLEPEYLTEIPKEMRKQPYHGYVEVERYWVNVPYAYITILKNKEQNDYRYFVNEPELFEDHEKLLLEEFKDRLSTELLYEDVEEEDTYEKQQEKKVKVLENKILEVLTEYDIDVDNETFHKLLYYLERDQVYYNKIDPLMNDPNIEDISCDGDNVPIFGFHREYKDLMSNVTFEKDELRSFIIQLAQRSGEHISIAEPLVDASLPDGSRAQLSLSDEVTSRGSSFTIRLFQDIPFTPVDLIQTNTFSKTQMSYLWLAIENNKSLIFAGGTASGKTTSMNAVSLFIPPKSKVVSIEDTREIELPHENWVATATRDSFSSGGGQDIDMYKLLESALRQRPEYMIVGEIRGEEAKSLFQAMSTGHTTYSTMHADTVGEAIYRLTNPPINVPVKMIEALDIMCIQNQVRFVDEDTGDVENVRRNEQVFEFIDIDENGQTEGHSAFERDQERDTWLERLDESNVLISIMEENGWTREKLERKIKQRERVLEYMVDNNITDFENVSKIIQTFMLHNKDVLEKIEDGSLTGENLRDIAERELTDEYMTPKQLKEKRQKEDDRVGGEAVENEAVRKLGDSEGDSDD